MSKLDKIKGAVAELTSKELARLRGWIEELEEQRWDAQIERDVKAGKLDKLVAEAIAEDEAGRSTEL